MIFTLKSSFTLLCWFVEVVASEDNLYLLAQAHLLTNCTYFKEWAAQEPCSLQMVILYLDFYFSTNGPVAMVHLMTSLT